MRTEIRTLEAGKLQRAIVGSLVERKLAEKDAIYVSETLITASLWGIDTHGVELLPTYLKELEGGRSKARPQMSWTETQRGVALLDANGGLGIVAGNLAMRRAIEIALDNGIAAVGVRNSNHFGAAGYYESSGSANRGCRIGRDIYDGRERCAAVRLSLALQRCATE